MRSYILFTLALFCTLGLAEPHFDTGHTHDIFKRAARVASSLTGPAVPSRFEKARIKRHEALHLEIRATTPVAVPATTVLPGFFTLAGIEEAFHPSSSRFPAAIVLAAAAGMLFSVPHPHPFVTFCLLVRRQIGIFVICISSLLILCCCKKRAYVSDRPKNTPPTDAFRRAAPRPFHSKASSISVSSTFSGTSSFTLAPSPMIEKGPMRFSVRSPSLPSATHPSHSDMGTTSPPHAPIYDIRGLAPESPQRNFPARPTTPERRPRTPDRPRPITPELRQLHILNSPIVSPLSRAPNSPPSAPGNSRRVPLPIIPSPQMPAYRPRESTYQSSDSEYEDEEENGRRLPPPYPRPPAATYNEEKFVYKSSLPLGGKMSLEQMRDAAQSVNDERDSNRRGQFGRRRSTSGPASGPSH